MTPAVNAKPASTPASAEFVGAEFRMLQPCVEHVESPPSSIAPCVVRKSV